MAKPRERGARWAELGEERACSNYCKFFISALPERSLIAEPAAKPASGAPLLRKFGNLSIREVLVVT